MEAECSAYLLDCSGWQAGPSVSIPEVPTLWGQKDVNFVPEHDSGVSRREKTQGGVWKTAQGMHSLDGP